MMRFTFCALTVGVLAACAALHAQDAAKKAAKPDESKAKPKAKAKPKKFANLLEVKVTTRTGVANKYAKTTSGLKVFLLLNGSESHKARLTNREKKPFALGAVDEFQLKFDMPADEVESVRLAVEGDDMWKCESFDLQFTQGGKTSPSYKFKVDRYLSTGKERKLFHSIPSMDFKTKIAFPENGDAEDKKSTGTKGE